MLTIDDLTTLLRTRLEFGFDCNEQVMCSLYSTEFKVNWESCGLFSPVGRGKDKDEARDEFARQIGGKVLVYKAGQDNEIVLQLPEKVWPRVDAHWLDDIIIKRCKACGLSISGDAKTTLCSKCFAQRWREGQDQARLGRYCVGCRGYTQIPDGSRLCASCWAKESSVPHGEVLPSTYVCRECKVREIELGGEPLCNPCFVAKYKKVPNERT